MKTPKYILPIALLSLALMGCSSTRQHAISTEPIAVPAAPHSEAIRATEGAAQLIPPGAQQQTLISQQSADMPDLAAPPPTASLTILPGTVSLEWNPSPDEEMVASYGVYYGLSSRSYIYQKIVASTNATLDGLTTCQTYYFAITAIDSLGVESDFSDELAYAPPQTFALRFETPGTALESSTDFVSWMPRQAALRSNTWIVVKQPDLPAEFYRQKAGD
jgi:hypothetical protein